jgi:hypothetical protein
VGIHAGILAKKNAIAPKLEPEQRFLVLSFLSLFCDERGIKIDFPELAELAPLFDKPDVELHALTGMVIVDSLKNHD